VLNILVNIFKILRRDFHLLFSLKIFMGQMNIFSENIQYFKTS